MTDFIEITQAETDPEAPITASLLKRLQNNPQAAFEGADGAYRLSASACEGSLAGDTLLRSSASETFGSTSEDVSKIIESSVYRFHAAGSVRFKGFGDIDDNGFIQIVKRFAGVPTPTVVVTDTSGTVSVDVSGLIGDVVYMVIGSNFDNTLGGLVSNAYCEHHTDTYRHLGGC